MMVAYRQYSDFLRELFPGFKVQKLSVNLGLGCPNRDGTLGTGGCIYCNNRAFTPSYCEASDTVSEQLSKGMAFFGKKYQDMKYLAYFQSYTSTYATQSSLTDAYSEALSVPGIVGLVVGTRPDCMSDGLLDFLASQNNEGKRVMVEYGVETMHDHTLRLINRHHTAACSRDAIMRTAGRGIKVGAHLIMGLPGEDYTQMLDTINQVCGLPISVIKLHQLQVVKGTGLEIVYKRQKGGIPTPGFPEIRLFTQEEYLQLCKKAIEAIPPHIAIDRFTAQSPGDLLIAPKWGIKNYQFVHRLHRLLEK